MLIANRIAAVLRFVEEAVAVAALAVLSLSVFLGVFFRYIVNRPLPWTNEVALISFVWLVFSAASIGVRQRSHLGVDYFYQLFPARARQVADVVIFGAIAIGVIVLIWLGYDQMLSVSGTRTPVLRISWAYAYGAVPLFGVFMLFYALQRIGNGLQLRRRKS